MFSSALIRQYNGQILNIYGESDSPGSFYTVVFCVFTIIYVCFGFSIGLTGYLAFGSGSDDTLIFNMPNQTWVGISIQILYIFTILGSYVILCQPIFRILENTETYKNILTNKEAIPEDEATISGQPEQKKWWQSIYGVLKMA